MSCTAVDNLACSWKMVCCCRPSSCICASICENWLGIPRSFSVADRLRISWLCCVTLRSTFLNMCSSMTICFMLRGSCALARPSTNSSIERTCWSSTSKTSNKATSSSLRMLIPTRCSCFSVASSSAQRMNSSRSSFPLPSRSCAQKQAWSHLRNSILASCARLISSSFMSAVAASMLSETTAVSKDIIVQEPKAMKKTKNMRHSGQLLMIGLAMSCQESIVRMRNKENSVVMTSPKCCVRASRSSAVMS
mmetsp:Transcript_11145/g.31672  ORF Transcript_11145/g.31672 Transcript_11145/m.31672 type:complete len:250 (+) Transcript_11145:127-876(+)